MPKAISGISSDMEKLNDEKLWNFALHGHPVIAALALAYLDLKFNGKIIEALKRQLKEESGVQK